MSTSERVTLKSLAKELDVSPATISLVLSGRGSELGISGRTQKRILDSSKKKRYMPHAGARMLRQQRSQTIAIVIRRGRYGLANATHAKMLSAAERVLSSHDYNMFISQVDVAYDVEHDAEFDVLDIPKPVREAAVDGVVFVSITPGKFASEIRRNLGGRPCVQVVGSKGIDAPDFTYSPLEAGRLAADYLYDLGHRRVACLCGPSHAKHATLTMKGFCNEWKNSSDSSELIVRNGLFEVESGRELALDILKNLRKGELTAFLCGNDMMAFGVIQAAWELGWRVPDELCVLGMDDVVACEWSSPPLTTLHLPHDQMIIQAIEYLIAKIEAKPAVTHPAMFEARLVERSSVLPRSRMSI